MLSAHRPLEDELVTIFRARLAGVLLPSGPAETCFVAFESNLAPLVHTHGLALSATGDVELSPEAGDLFGEAKRRLNAIGGILDALAIPRGYARKALRAWARAHWERVLDQRPADLLGHVARVEEQMRTQNGVTTRKRKLGVDALHALDAPGIVAHPQVANGVRTTAETVTGSVPDGLGELFVRLAAPRELGTLRARPQPPGLSLDEKIAKAKKRAEVAEREGRAKVGSGKKRRRPLPIADHDVPMPAQEPDESRPRKIELEAILATLTREQRSVLLAVGDLRSTTRAAERLGKSPQAVQNLLVRAREKARKLGFGLMFGES